MVPKSKNISLKSTYIRYPSCGKKEIVQLEQYSLGSHLSDAEPQYSYRVKVLSHQDLGGPRVSQCGMKVGSYGYKTHLVPRPGKTRKYGRIGPKMLQARLSNINITELYLHSKQPAWPSGQSAWDALMRSIVGSSPTPGELFFFFCRRFLLSFSGLKGTFLILNALYVG